MVVKALIARTILVGLAAYALVPISIWKLHPATGFLLGYAGNIVTFSVMTSFALLIQRRSPILAHGARAAARARLSRSSSTGSPERSAFFRTCSSSGTRPDLRPRRPW